MLTIPLVVLASIAVTAGPDPLAPDAMLAEGVDVRVTAAEFQARLAEQSPLIRQRYGTLERKREFLDQLIRFEVLVGEARRRGLDRDPEVLATLEKLMVQRLVQLSFADGGG